MIHIKKIVNRMHFFISLPHLQWQTFPLHPWDWHTMCIKREVIEKRRKLIFSIRFRRLCRLTARQNVLIAKQSTLSFASDNSANVTGISFNSVFDCTTGSSACLFPCAYDQHVLHIRKQSKEHVCAFASQTPYFVFHYLSNDKIQSEQRSLCTQT